MSEQHATCVARDGHELKVIGNDQQLLDWMTAEGTDPLADAGEAEYKRAMQPIIDRVIGAISEVSPRPEEAPASWVAEETIFQIGVMLSQGEKVFLPSVGWIALASDCACKAIPEPA